jgi:hypothetical protein
MIRNTLLAFALVGFSGASIASAAPTPVKAAPIVRHNRIAKPHVAKAADPAPSGDSKQAAPTDEPAVKPVKKNHKKHGAKAGSSSTAPAPATEKASPAPATEKTAPAPATEKAPPAPVK